ncbi:MAG: hypothetical protein D6731_17430 [Planctomycetota bacterium]|nr:MAG: hypothetical protein D6731_17430 [Planctomycetota bacterium]
MARSSRRSFFVRRLRRGQATVELIIVVGLVVLALAWLTAALPRALSHHYAENQKILVSPL